MFVRSSERHPASAPFGSHDLIQSSNYYTLSEMNELNKSENDIAVFHTNISSLAYHFDTFEAHLKLKHKI